MDTKYHVVNDNRQSQVVKKIRKVVPDIRRPVFFHTLRVEPVCLVKITDNNEGILGTVMNTLVLLEMS